MTKRQAWYSILYIQVIIAIIAGAVMGYTEPAWAITMKPFGDAFISAIKMMIAPIIFCTVVHGIGSVSDLSKVGRVGVKALFYFEVVSTIALVIGLVVGRIVEPGAGFAERAVSNVDLATVQGYEKAVHSQSIIDFLLSIIPKTFAGAFTGDNLLPILLISVLCGVALVNMGEAGRRITDGIDLVAQMFFRVIGIIVKFAPIGAFGAMAFVIGKFGIGALIPLMKLVATFYITSLLFVLVVLGLIARFSGFSILRFLAYIKDELLIVVGTSSSESVLPNLMRKMERLGASKSVVGLVVPTGYSFNLDGTNIYMTLAVWFLAQATHTDLTLTQELSILGIALLTSKGASGVTGAGFVTLIATLQAVPGTPIPWESVAIIFGIDKFMSECRALTNLVGNGVACIVVSRWEGELDKEALNQIMAHPLKASDEVEAEILGARTS